MSKFTLVYVHTELSTLYQINTMMPGTASFPTDLALAERALVAMNDAVGPLTNFVRAMRVAAGGSADVPYVAPEPPASTSGATTIMGAGGISTISGGG